MTAAQQSAHSLSTTSPVGTLPKSPTEQAVVLDVKNLKVYYQTPTGDVRAVDDISFQIYEGEIVGLVGESGCGKTTTAMAILRLVQPPGRITGGTIMLDGVDIASLPDRELRDVRWRSLALIPQGAMNSLNPVMRISRQIADVIETHEGRQAGKALKERIFNLLRMVGLPTRVYDMYPHELSGGMKQRVCIAMAVALNPPLVIADEPTSALDVIVQRVVAQNLLDIKARLGVSMIVIGHDMGLMAQLADRVAVMYAGHMVEISPVRQLYAQPMHPYTQLLIEAIPSIKERKPLKITEGITHDLRNPPPGCIFQARCPHVMAICRQVRPPLKEHSPRQQVACHLYE
ncbi:MAG: ABC transporter ATP-binding protein [Caldilineaceae bacterium]|nr:ABC transporter ATP-binding protein [Caldilineaceae bacterium]